MKTKDYMKRAEDLVGALRLVQVGVHSISHSQECVHAPRIRKCFIGAAYDAMRLSGL